MLTLADGRRVSAAVSVQLMSDDVTRELAINLPADQEVVRAEVVVGSEKFDVDVGALD
jgi:hypothetical protein